MCAPKDGKLLAAIGARCIREGGAGVVSLAVLVRQCPRKSDGHKPRVLAGGAVHRTVSSGIRHRESVVTTEAAAAPVWVSWHLFYVVRALSLNFKHSGSLRRGFYLPWGSPSRAPAFLTGESVTTVYIAQARDFTRQSEYKGG